MSFTSSSSAKAGWSLEQFRARVYDSLEKHARVFEKPFGHDSDSAWHLQRGPKEVERVTPPGGWQNPVISQDLPTASKAA